MAEQAKARAADDRAQGAVKRAHVLAEAAARYADACASHARERRAFVALLGSPADEQQEEALAAAEEVLAVAYADAIRGNVQVRGCLARVWKKGSQERRWAACHRGCHVRHATY